MMTWWETHGRRAMAAAKSLLRFFRKAGTDGAVTLACECITDLAVEAERKGFSWTIETAVKRAPEWLAGKMKEK